MALDIGAQSHGHWSGCHAVAWDMNAPAFGDRNIADLFQKHSYPFGLIVNVEGKRFVDEGADLRNYTYAKYGKEILAQPQRVAFQLFDQKTEAPAARRVLHTAGVGGGGEYYRGTGGRAWHRCGGYDADDSGVQCCGAAGRVQPDGAGRQAHGRDRTAEVELGAGRWTRRRIWATR